jgi:chorismate lyase/3-hydroxybenzoate synthase
LRIWNYIDAIGLGDGDDERYRQFCVGRDTALRGYTSNFPAATAIGRHDGARSLQVYWLSARNPGLPLENPRQVAAYHYPRQYGPRPPSFARAMLGARSDGLPMMLSGTASVVGHASCHQDLIGAQVEESLRNVYALLQVAHVADSFVPLAFGARSLLKIYVREPSHLTAVERQLDASLGADVARIVLHAEICRRELLVEIDGFHSD